MSTILFKLAGRLERKWLLTKKAQQKPLLPLPAPQATNIQKFDAAYVALRGFVAELNKPEYKLNQTDKSIIIKMFTDIDNKIRSNAASEEWIFDEGIKLFTDNRKRIHSLASTIYNTLTANKDPNITAKIATISDYEVAMIKNIESIVEPPKPVIYG